MVSKLAQSKPLGMRESRQRGSHLWRRSGLGHLVTSGKDLREELVSKGLHHRADLVLGDHVAVELVGVVRLS